MNKTIQILLICFLAATCNYDYSIVTNEKVELIPEQVEEQEVEVVVDYFQQPEKPDNLDVLVILDTSCSMSDNFENVSAGLDILRGDIENLTYDYQMGLINSSMTEQYYTGIIDSDTSSLEIYLAPYELASDRVEHAFNSLYQFTNTEEGEYFLRDGVDKLYIFVSDEPEQSSMPVSLFKEWMDEYHEDVEHDIVVIGINDESDCGNHYILSEDSENRFLIFANYYNKMIIDICGDFQLALADNSFLIHPVTHLNLSKTPIEDTIVVYQDGIIENNWYYLAQTNTVYFEFEIKNGGIIKIGYNSYL